MGRKALLVGSLDLTVGVARWKLALLLYGRGTGEYSRVR